LTPAALVADQQRPAADQQPQPQGEHDRHGDQLGSAQPPLSGHARRRLFLLVLGAILQFLGQLLGHRFHHLLLEPARAGGIAGGHGRQRPVGDLPVALQVGADLLGEPGLVGIGMLHDEPNGVMHGLDRQRQLVPGFPPSMLGIVMAGRLGSGQLDPGVLPDVLLGAVTIDLPGGGVGAHRRPQAEPGQQHQHHGKPEGGQPAAMPSRPPLSCPRWVPHWSLRPSAASRHCDVRCPRRTSPTQIG
jgi:hypothetical protein